MKYTKPNSTVTAILALLLISFISDSVAHARATFSINYTDGTSEGFNDPSVAIAPDGGNTGTTLGSQRKIAFEYAISKLADILHSDVTIVIDAHFDPLGGSEFSATLAQAGPNTVHFNFLNAPQTEVYYVQALANKLNGNDLDSSADIDAQFNSDVDGSTVLGVDAWYYGLDASPPGQDTDFVTVAIHELLHGLGFLSLVDTRTGAKLNNRDDIYSFHLERFGASVSQYPAMTNAQRASANKSTGNLQWAGTETQSNAVLMLTSGLNETKPQMYAPNPIQEGSSISHFSDALSPIQLMQPYYSHANHDINIAGAVLADMGWGNFTNLSVTLTDASDPIAAGNDIELTATISNIGTSNASNAVLTYAVPSGLSVRSVLASQGTCSTLSDSVSCALGTIDAGGSTSVSLTLSTTTTATVSHLSTITANIVDFIASNNSDSETTTIQAEGSVTSNVAPTANAGSDKTVSTGSSVSLSGSASTDSDGTIVAYRWLQIGGTQSVSLSGSTSSTATFTAPAATDMLIFQLLVTDEDGATSTDTISVTVALNSSGGGNINDESTSTDGSIQIVSGAGGGGGAFDGWALFSIGFLFVLYSRQRMFTSHLVSRKSPRAESVKD